MMPFEWTQVLFGVIVGIGMSTVYFVGLAYSVRIALRSGRSMLILTISATLRIAMLLGIGWLVTSYLGPWAIYGYGGSFFIARFVATAVANTGARVRPSS